MTDETLILLGTGNATVTKCFNTCFAIKTGEEYFLVDTGGGNGIMTQLEKAGIPMESIHEIFMSHEHTDHLLGLIWLIRHVGKFNTGKVFLFFLLFGIITAILLAGICIAAF